ncbi:hypothetical protein KSP40_PGU006370 [Platanthera guangdongensis]|uniref:Uncharacterized protein n=1 Tax=Platanthera guangdongensis TaxID=2320717 RepID=A0ABR2MFZ1_9ASPA
MSCTEVDAILSEEIRISTREVEVQIIPNAPSNSFAVCVEEQCADSGQCDDPDGSDFGITPDTQTRAMKITLFSFLTMSVRSSFDFSSTCLPSYERPLLQRRRL